ncbi:delta 9-fatty acid desaturase protein [Flagelloscypha sp. PMI_526]|nr:delta 9-fatty acid desaturase protein [Flagelloscypha sp. PMI_526]
MPLEAMLEQLPPITGIRWFNLVALIITPAFVIYGTFIGVPCNPKTAMFSVFYFMFTMIDVSGYHRLWSHRSYNASLPLRLFLILGGSSAVQGSCHWWARSHRLHHRYTDTNFDPYNSKRGLFWTHVGWIIFRTSTSPSTVDVSDLRNSKLVMWQHRYYFILALILGVILPSAVPGLFWDDWMGGFTYAAMMRLTVAHHSVFSVNSIAHWLGETPYDDRHTPRDHLLTAIVTLGEGYHNFHHQFPMDYRNAFRWYQFDPTKWFIALCSSFGLASNLRVFPSNEVEKSALIMKLRGLKGLQDSLEWPKKQEELPVVTWETFQKESNERNLILVSGFIHDVTGFLTSHPGGAKVLEKARGKDSTSAFFGGIYPHSNAAHNLLAMKRVGILNGGVEVVSEEHISPSERLRIIK